MQSLINEAFDREVKCAVGCTEVATIGLVSSLALNTAMDNLDEDFRPKRRIKAKWVREINNILLTLDPFLFKNAADAGIPWSDGGRGIKLAATLGLFGDPSRKLQIFDSVSENHLKLARKLEKTVRVRIKDSIDELGIYVEAKIETEKRWGRAIVQHDHDNIVLVESNRGCYFKAGATQRGREGYREAFKELAVKDLIDYVDHLPTQIKAIVKKGIKLVKDLSDEGLKKSLGIGVGHALEDGADDIKTYIKIRTASAIDARMFGVPKPSVVVAGSGNQGIMTTMPICAYSERSGMDEDLLVRSIALFYLVTIYISCHSSYLGAVCGLGSKAGAGASAGLAYYMSNGDGGAVKKAIKNFVAGIPGMICDGGKYSCALKGAIATDAVYQSVQLALKNRETPHSGILGKDVEESIRNLGKIIKGARPLNNLIVEIVFEKQA